MDNNYTNVNKCPNLTYSCECCSYNTGNKKDYNKHLVTRKHLSKISFNDLSQQNIDCNQYHTCANCNCSYNSRQALYYHKKKCIPPPILQDASIVNELIKQNQDFKQTIINQSKNLEELYIKQEHRDNQIRDLLIEIAKKDNSVIYNNTTNQQFNLNMFLNEQCKDAMNFIDFVDSLNISFEELENMAHKGYVSGMSDIILNGLKQLDIYHRPIHCTDIKRETMYIRDNDEWMRDENQMKIQKIINMVSKKNMKRVPDWHLAHPKSDITDSKEQYLHMNIMQQCLNSGCLAECKRNDAKIIKNIAKFTYLDRGKNLV